MKLLMRIAVNGEIWLYNDLIYSYLILVTFKLKLSVSIKFQSLDVILWIDKFAIPAGVEQSACLSIHSAPFWIKFDLDKETLKSDF